MEDILWLAQVYWVFDIIKQPRVIATDRDENYISIPLDYKQRFHIIERGQSNRLPCLQLVRVVCNVDSSNSQGRSVCQSVRPSVTFRCFVQTNKDTIVRPWVSSRTIILASGEINFIRIFAGRALK